MKILTLNTHSLIEENYEEKINIFINAINKIKPDIIALQEVNQTLDSPIINNLPNGVSVAGKISLKKDNHALLVREGLKKNGTFYNMVWLGIKNGFDCFDEGLAVLSLLPVEETDFFTISQNDDYSNWKTRKALGVKINNEWFFNTHMGWWKDEEEPFIKQWEILSKNLKKYENIWLMGDFNCDSYLKNEGYDCIINSGWYDTYALAKEKDDGKTVSKRIDGWRDSQKKRIDYIFSDKKTLIKSSYLIFNGKNEEVVSDHFGIIIEVER